MGAASDPDQGQRATAPARNRTSPRPAPGDTWPTGTATGRNREASTTALAGSVPARSVRTLDLIGPFTRRQALECGLTRGELQGPRYRRLSREVYVPYDLGLSPEVMARAALLASPCGVLSHPTAVLAHGLPLAVGERPPGRPHLTTPVGTPTSDREAHVDHVALVPDWQIVQTAWGRATSPARTYLDRAEELGLHDLVALGDAALNRGLTTFPEIESVVRWGSGRRGVVLARRGLRLLDGRAVSPMESWARVQFHLGGAPRPEVNADVHDRHGGWLARGDLVWREQRLIVEYDGAVHGSERARRADARRRALLTAEGWTVYTITADDVLRRPHDMVAWVLDFLARAA